MFNLQRSCIAIALSAVAAGPVYSQALDEIIVTATKREESIQDVAMSIQAFTGDSLKRLSIDDMADMATMVPNFTVSDGLIINQITMRGLGSGEDRGFDTPVSTFKNGIYMARNRQTRSPFFDVERVEILRGPQAVLFGLNSTAGAISFHDAINKPGDDFEATVSGEYEAEYDGIRATFVVGGSVTDNLALRFAGEHLDSGDGWLTNGVGGAGGQQEHDLLRLSAVWTPTDSLTITARYENNDFSVDGQITEITGGGVPGGLEDRVVAANSIIPGSLNTDGENSVFDWISFHSDVPALQDLHSPIDRVNYRDPLGADQELENISVAIDYDINDYTVSGLFGYSDYFFDTSINVGGLADPFWFGTNYESYDQTSFELRLASPAGQTFEWVAGAYVHDATMFTDQPNAVDLGIAFGYNFGLPPAVVEAAILGAPLYELTGSALDQDTTLTSLFVSGTWNVSDELRVSGGVRYSDEEKTYFRDPQVAGSGLYLKNPDGTIGPFLGGAIFGGTGAAVGPSSGTTSSSPTMPELMIEWDSSDNVMFWGRYAQSTKAGGVATAGSTAASGVVYRPEDAESFEIGLKSTFLDGRAIVNATIFTTEYTDMQLKSSVINGGVVETVIGNAGSATSEGIELDGLIAVNDWLMLGGNVAWLDAQLDSYDSGPCNISGSTPPGAVAGSCDLGGQQLPFAADFSGSLFADVTVPVTGNVNLVGNFTWAFSDEYRVEGTLEPTMAQKSWNKTSGRIGIEAVDDSWTLAVVGKNLTNEKVWLGGQPLFGYSMMYVTPPRTLTIQGSYRF
jgi:iron complex outermembrane receptor protein